LGMATKLGDLGINRYVQDRRPLAFSEAARAPAGAP
jgi:hypothetical protein